MKVLKLKTPFDPGMYDPNNTYGYVLITSFNLAVLQSIIDIRWEYGTLTSTGWQSGKAGMPQQTIVQDDDFWFASQRRLENIDRDLAALEMLFIDLYGRDCWAQSVSPRVGGDE